MIRKKLFSVNVLPHLKSKSTLCVQLHVESFVYVGTVQACTMIIIISVNDGIAHYFPTKFVCCQKNLFDADTVLRMSFKLLVSSGIL